ncbi:MAG: hypothetical protein AB8B74_13745 [Crocinitomicaceae bacterium]
MIRVTYKLTIFLLFVVLIQSCGLHFVSDYNATERYTPSTNKEYILSDYELENTTWIVHLSRIQCETIYYANLESAMDFLSRNNVLVLHAKNVGRPTNCACGSPSGRYFAARINNEDKQQALNLGWHIPNELEVKVFNLD